MNCDLGCCSQLLVVASILQLTTNHGQLTKKTVRLLNRNPPTDTNEAETLY